jgi:hypothetical protein
MFDNIKNRSRALGLLSIDECFLQSYLIPFAQWCCGMFKDGALRVAIQFGRILSPFLQKHSIWFFSIASLPTKTHFPKEYF